MSLKNLSVRKKIPKIYKSKLLNQKVNKIFKKFEKSFKIDTNFIVAVSGGADSLALAFLTKVYSLKKNLNPRYFIVDHKLRKESTYEAYKVKKILKKQHICNYNMNDNGLEQKRLIDHCGAMTKLRACMPLSFILQLQLQNGKRWCQQAC